ncbi:MAG: phosphoglycerate dehydrogenase [Chlorobi bacterium]|nr:phosphoglycerate dehydrogenase [Chlorobiota bacterium]MCI0714841.1 phosphoglycerate dehydrogenase [Chlorobiota bacterium]
MYKKYFIIDFDSTFIKVEALEELAEISLKKDKGKETKIAKVRELTLGAMNGEVSFTKSLKERIRLLNANKSHLVALSRKLNSKISRSIISNKKFFKDFSKNIIIISGGFKEYILPVVSKFHISEKQVYANTFTFDKKGNVTGFDSANLLAKKNGKAKLIKKLNLNGELIAIGDGHTDYELKKSGLVHKFYAFTENVEREVVAQKADYVTPSFDEFLYVSKLPMSISYPKNRIKVLLLENIHKDAVSLFINEGYRTETVSKSLSERELAERIKDISILGIRSKTHITQNVLKEAKKLLAIGAFCIGTNQIDLDGCSNRGVIVFNAPFSNTRSVVELVIGEIIMLMRGIFDKSSKLHKGVWNKSSANSFEVRGKKLGIVGYGKIGSQLSVLAEDMGMEVYYYDILEKLALGNAKKCSSLKELIKKADIITVHIDGNEQNHNLIGEGEFKLMKEGVVFLNLSRGFVVDIKSLVNNIKSGKIRGAAIDVFPHEPESNDEKFISELQSLPNVILTPHIGGSTNEAQKDIAGFVPSKVIDFINSGNSYYSVNFPNIQLPSFEKAHRLIHIHHNVPGVLANINSIFAKHNINIIGQYLKTNELIGYVITDISKKYNPELISELKKVAHTIKFRILY